MTRRGLTLIETLAALVLLALLAATAGPVLRSLGVRSPERVPAERVRVFAVVVDALVSDEQAGLAALNADGDSIELATDAWDGTIAVVRTDLEDSPDLRRIAYARLTFTSDGITLARWIRTDPRKAAGS